MEGFVNPLIIPFIKENGYRNLCQIGVSHGNDTDRLLILKYINITIIDPCLDEDLPVKYKNFNNVEICKGLSLEILPKIEKRYDCILIDGDHNWYTVFNELAIIEQKGLLNDGGAIFLHDVGWPYGRRDMYYLPESIPENFRHPYAKRNVVRGKSELSKVEEGGCNNAIYEHGPRNGILTAVEDFLQNRKKEYVFINFDIFHGLGMLVKGKENRRRIILLKWVFVAKCINLFWMVIKLFKSESFIYKMRKSREKERGNN